MSRYLFGGVLAACMLAAGSVQAHHSFAAEFDANKPITLKGIVTKIEWTNPHVWFYVNVKDEKTGEMVNWGAEMGPPHGLQRRGWRRDTLKIGEEVTVVGSMAKNGSKRMNARTRDAHVHGWPAGRDAGRGVERRRRRRPGQVAYVAAGLQTRLRERLLPEGRAFRPALFLSLQSNRRSQLRRQPFGVGSARLSAFERRHNTFRITTDVAAMDLDAIHAYLTRSYWSEGISKELVAKAIAGSLCFGLVDGGRQVGFARVITDRATYAYLCDVYVLEEDQGRGLGTWLMREVMTHPDLQGLRRFGLVTRDAHGLYEKLDSPRSPIHRATWRSRGRACI